MLWENTKFKSVAGSSEPPAGLAGLPSRPGPSPAPSGLSPVGLCTHRLSEPSYLSRVSGCVLRDLGSSPGSGTRSQGSCYYSCWAPRAWNSAGHKLRHFHVLNKYALRVDYSTGTSLIPILDPSPPYSLVHSRLPSLLSFSSPCPNNSFISTQLKRDIIPTDQELTVQESRHALQRGRTTRQDDR